MSTTQRPPFPPAIGVAVAVASVSFAAPLFALADAGPITASFWRLAFAVALLLPFTRRSWPVWRTFSWRTWTSLVAAGFALAFHFATWVASLQYLSVAASTALVTLQAIFVALGGHFLLSDKLSGRGWLGVCIAIIGAVIITLADEGAGPGARPLLGAGLALIAGLGSAAYLLIGRRARATLDLISYVTPVYAAAAITLLFAALLSREPVGAAVGPNFLWFVLLAAVPMLGGHTMANWSMRYVPAHVVATWILLEPLGAALLAWPILGQVPNANVLAGAGIVIQGAWLTVSRPATPRRSGQ